MCFISSQNIIIFTIQGRDIKWRMKQTYKYSVFMRITHSQTLYLYVCFMYYLENTRFLDLYWELKTKHNTYNKLKLFQYNMTENKY